MPPRRPRARRAAALTDLSPLRILTQIIALQSIFYVSATILILFTALVAGRSFTLDLVLSWRSLRGDNTVGWMLGLVWMLNSVVLVVFILLLVARSKLVPDFALTLHFLHLVVTSLYSRSIPTNWLWWALQASSAALMTFLGIWSCQWRELRPIKFGGSGASGATDSTQAGATAGEDEEAGFTRGMRRGRGRDGAGEYELTTMNDDTRL